MGSPQTEKQNRVWSIIGKIALVLGIIWVFIQMYSYLTKNDVEIEAQVFYGSFSIPEGIFDFYSSEGCTAKLAYEYSKLRAYWHTVITNTGEIEADSIRLTLPMTEFIRIVRENGDTTFRASGDQISLGNLQPKESIVVQAWCDNTIVGLLHADKVRLTHSTGVGEVAVMQPVGPFWAWASFQWRILKDILFFLIPLLALIAFMPIAYYKWRKQVRDNSDKPSDS